MNKIRFRVIVLVIWFFSFYNLERLIGPVNKSAVTFSFVPAAAVIALLSTRWPRLPFWAPSVVLAGLYALLKYVSGFELLGPAMQLTVTEIGAVVVSTELGRWIGTSLTEFEGAVSRITMNGRSLPAECSDNTAELYREIRRARQCERPLSLLVIDVDQQSVQFSIDRLVKETQHTMLHQYALAGVSQTLAGEMQDAIIARLGNRLILVAPDIGAQQLPEVVGRLRWLVSDQVGVSLQIGAATYPNDASTFDELVNKAAEKIEARPQPRPEAVRERAAQ